MRQLTIYRHYFTDSDCYNAAKVQTQRGVQAHCTTKGASYLKRWVGPDDGRLGKNQYSNYHNRPGGDVCASAYIGKLADKTVACYQALPWDYRCWLSGSYDNGNANKLGYIGFEIASDNWDDEAYFREAVMGVSVNLTAYLCTRMGVRPRAVLESYKEGDALAVMDHSELRKVKLASNHSDISKWLKVYGLTMDDYRDAVEAGMEEGVEVTYIDALKGLPPRTLRKGDRGNDVQELQRMLNADSRYPTKVDGIFGADTTASVRAFQHDHGLTADGIVGPKTWEKLMEVTLPDEGDKTEEDKSTDPPVETQTPSDIWETLSLEDKVENLHERLKRQEGGESDG